MNRAVVILNTTVIIVYDMSYHDICNGLSSYKLWLIFRQVIVRLVLCSLLDLFSGNLVIAS